VRIGQRTVRLSALWKQRPVLLSFLLKDCLPCKRHVTTVERALGRHPEVTVVYVLPSERQAASLIHDYAPTGLVATSVGESLQTAYQAWNAPSAFLIRDGRLAYVRDERSDDRVLERLLAGVSRSTRRVASR
jgi:hypothetical protein